MPERHDLLPPFPSPTCARLNNGLSLALQSRPGLAKTAISVRVMAGSHDEPSAFPGLAHFLEHLLFLGSDGYALEQGLMAFVQECGGQVNASTQARHTDYFCEVPAPLLGEALARLLDMLARPLLEQGAQLREREVVHAEYIARGQDADTLIDTALGQALPAGHRCGAFLAGNRETLAVDSAAFQQALRDFHRRFYQAGHLSLVLVGPQSLAELHDLARQHAGALPSVPRAARSPAPALVPLRARQLRMSLPGPASLQLGFALELPAAQASAAQAEALDYLIAWLPDESPGGLLAGLRAAGLCSGLQVRVAYRHGGQALLVLSLAGVEPAPASRAVIAAAVGDWLRFFAAQGGCAPMRAGYRAQLNCRLHSLGPLALARYWQDGMEAGRDPAIGLSDEGREVLSRLLAQMQASERMISLFASPDAAADWPSDGFALHMEAEVLAAASPRSWGWRLPAANPLLAGVPAEPPVLDTQARLRWLQPSRPGGDPGVGAFLGRCRCADVSDPAPLLAFVQAQLRAVQAQAGQAGVSLQLALEGEDVQLALQGPAPLVPRVLASALQALFDTPAEALRPPSEGAAQMPIRQLLRRLPELFATEPGASLAANARPAQERLRLARWEGLGVGLTQADQARIERLFRRVAPLVTPEPVVTAAAGRHWLDAQLGCAEAVLLLFCPQPAGDAATEAGWRLLAQLYQGAFYRRLRGELQLGYALFCGYRQVRGRRGVLFAVQSPCASAAQILGHIEDFLRSQGERLAALADDQLARAVGELDRQLRAGSAAPGELAERHWQQHLAGLPPSHDAALQAALAGISRQQLLQLHRCLCQAQGGWHLLSDSRQADSCESAAG